MSPRRKAAADRPPVRETATCPYCKGELVDGQNVPATFRMVRQEPGTPHPVLSTPIVLTGIVGLDGPIIQRPRFTLDDHLRQRAAMGGAREQAALEKFESIFTKWLASALVAAIQREDAACAACGQNCAELSGKQGPCVCVECVRVRKRP